MDTESDKFRDKETFKSKRRPITEGNEKEAGTLTTMLE